MNQIQIDQIFNRQIQLATQFGSIEEDNTSLPFKDVPNILTTYKGQFVIRFMLTCVHDELWEASQMESMNDVDHLEELADVLHYVVEVCLRVGIWPTTPCPIPPDTIDLKQMYQQIGELYHELKAKPWKVHPKETNISQVMFKVERLFWSFLRFVNSYNFTDEQLHEAYFAKAKVNQQRIDTGA